MRTAALALAAVLALSATPAAAIDPGTATGHFVSDELKVPKVAHAIALSMDNAEGQLERPSQVRVLLSEEEVPPSALMGLVFTPAHAMAKAGALHGLLLEFDPADRNGVYVTILAPPSEPGRSFTTLTLSSTEGVWTRLDVNATRVVGELKPNDTFDVAATFSSPVFSDPVRQDLKGPAARQSAPVGVLLARFDALAKGDIATAKSLSTATAAEQLAAMPPDMLAAARAQIPQLVGEVKAARRVVIRGETASVETADGGWFSLAREGGNWKAAD